MRRSGFAAGSAFVGMIVTIVACGTTDGDAPPTLANEGGLIDGPSAVDGSTPMPPVDSGPADAGADPCAAKVATCPTTTATEGSGLTAIDRCAFGMVQGTSASVYSTRIDALTKITTPVTLASVIADSDRDGVVATTVPGAPAGLTYAMMWNDEDETSARWFPQGITGSADASPDGKINGKTVVLVSFYDNGTGSYEKGARVAFVDLTTPSAPKYRFALLVEPVGTADFAPVKVHAGGMVWFGDLLYVVETGKGFRVFDMSRLLQVATDMDLVGCTSVTCHAGLYKYVVPQIDAFATASTCTPKPIFSFVSLDRSSSPPSLVSGEYCSTTACAGPLAGRLFRWPLDSSAKGTLTPGKSWPSEALLMGQKQVQGAASRSGVTYLSSSAPAAAGGALYRVAKTKSATSSWADSPEDLMIDPTTSTLWSLSEGVSSRYVFSVQLSSYPAP